MLIIHIILKYYLLSVIFWMLLVDIIVFFGNVFILCQLIHVSFLTQYLSIHFSYSKPTKLRSIAYFFHSFWDQVWTLYSMWNNKKMAWMFLIISISLKQIINHHHHAIYVYSKAIIIHIIWLYLSAIIFYSTWSKFSSMGVIEFVNSFFSGFLADLFFKYIEIIYHYKNGWSLLIKIVNFS